MSLRSSAREPELNALLISPDRELSRQFAATLVEAHTFQIVSELKAYPPEQTLEMRLRQIQPDVVLLDLNADFEAASQLLQWLGQQQPAVQVIGLHYHNDGDLLIRALRAGATEFLHAPFDAAAQREAVNRVRRLREPESLAPPEQGKVVVFTSAKPGSGASTLATQSAFYLKRLTGKRVLLADFDVMGGSIAFALKLNAPYSLLDALERSEQLDPALWAMLTVNTNGVDVLPAPECASSDALESSRLHDVIEYARLLYDFVVLDLPSIFHRISLFALSEADQSLLISTPELPSLHLARRAVGLLGQLGFGRDRFQMVINRIGKRDGITTADMEKIFGCPVFASFPNDYYALHRVVTRAEPLPPDCELGRSLDSITSRIAGLVQKEKKTQGGILEHKPALSAG